MRAVFLFSLLISTLLADFISTYEYGEALYRDPRGISCAKCHGDDGAGRLISTVIDGKTRHEITAPNIKNVSRDRIAFALRRGRSVMPVYKLTEEEIEALYIYLNTQK